MRDTLKRQTAKESILASTGCKNLDTVQLWELDLANYASVVSFAEHVNA